MRRTSASTPRPCHPQPPAPLAHRPRAPPPLPYLTSTTTAITRSWGRVLSYTFEHLTGTTTMRSSGWGTTRAMRSCAKPIESWLSSKQVGLEFSSPPHPSWLASRCLRHRVHLLSTQLHLCRVRSHHPVQAYSTLRLLSGTTRISKKTRSRLKSPPRSLGSWVTPTRCSSAGDRERLQPHVPSPGCSPEHPGYNPLCPSCVSVHLRSCRILRSGRPTTTSSAYYGRSRKIALSAAPPPLRRRFFSHVSVGGPALH